MAKRTISTRYAVDGEAQYKQAITAINTELKKQASALDLVQSQYKTNANSIDALQSKQKALADLQSVQANKIKELNAAYKNAQGAVDAYRDKKDALTQKIEANEAALEKLKNTEGDTTEEQKKLTEETDKLKKQLEDNEARLTAAEKGANNWQTSLNKAQIELNKTNDEIKKNDRYLDEARKSTDKCATSIDKYGKETRITKESVDALSSALSSVGLVAALKQVADGLIACLEASIKFESAMTGVEKTTDLTDRELSQMSDALKDLSGTIPMAASDLAKITENAGQLGIAKENLVSFTSVMADLGVATNLSGEQAAQSIAKIANITGMAQTDVDRFGSAVVALGNNFATTESDIVMMANRLASAGTLAKLTEPEILALATAMSSVGIEAEAGGTAMTQTLTAIEKAAVGGGENLEEFARIAGMTADEFAVKWKTAPIEAIQAFLIGLGNLESQGESATLVLDDMGLSGIRQSNMLKSLGLAAGTVTSAVSLSNKAWTENTALTKEAQLRYSTTESRLQLLKNAFERVEMTVGDQLNPALNKLIDAGTGVLGWIDGFLKENDAIVPVVTAVTVALGVMVAGIAAMTLASTVGAKALIAFKAALDTATGGVTFIITAVVALAAALGTLALSFDDDITRAEELAEAAFNASERVKEINTAFDDAKESAEVAATVAQSYIDELKDLEAQGLKTNEEQDRYRVIVEQLNELMPELNLAIDEQTGLIKGGTDALLLNIEALKQKYLQEAYQKKYNDLLTQEAQIKVELYDAERRKAAEDKRREGLEQRRNDLLDAQIKRTKELNENAEELSKKTGVLEDSGAAWDSVLLNINDELQDVNKEIYDSTTQTNEYQEAIDKSNESLGHLGEELTFAKEGYEGLTEPIETLTAEQQKIIDSLNSTSVALEELKAAHIEAYDAAYENISNQIGLFESISEKSYSSAKNVDKAIGDMISSLESQSKYMDTYAENIKKAIEKGVDKGLVQKLSDGSVESAKTLATIVQGGEDKIKELNEKFGKVEEGKQKFAGTVADMETDFKTKMDAINKKLDGFVQDMNKADEAAKAAKETGSSYASGLRSKYNEVYNASAALAKASNKGWKDYYQQHSPSKLAIKEASQTADSYIYPFEERAKKMEETVGKFALAANDAYVDTMKDVTLKATPILYNLSGAQKSEPAKPIKCGDINIQIDARGMTVRNDSDIKKISQGLATEVERKIAAKGGKPA